MMQTKSSLGISFTKDRVDVICLKRFLRKTSVTGHTSIPFSIEMGADAFKKGITPFLSANRLISPAPYVSLPREDVILSTVELPASVEGNLREVLGYELDRLTPFSRDTASFDFQILERTADGKRLKVLLAVIEKARLESYLAILEAAGLEPASVEISSTALVGALLYAGSLITEFSLDGGLNAMIYTDADACEILLVRGKTLTYSRSFGRTDDTAGTILGEYDKALKAGGADVVSGRTFVCGKDTDNDELLRGIRKMTGRDAVVFGLIKGMEIIEGLNDDTLGGVLGCGLRGISTEAAPLNLLPARVGEGPGVYAVLRTAAVLLAVTALLWAGGTALRMTRERGILSELGGGIAALESSVKEAQEVKDNALKLEASLFRIEDFNAAEVPVLKILRELTGVLPMDTYLTMLKSDGDEIEMVGRSSSAVRLLSLLDESPLFKDVRFAATVTRKDPRAVNLPRDKNGGGKATEEFRIKARVVRGP
jgi:general secretion pathway protein L